MFEYLFVNCPVRFYRMSGTVELDDYRDAVRARADEGWRLVQVFIPVPAAVPSSYELIFERPRRDPAPARA